MTPKEKQPLSFLLLAVLMASVKAVEFNMHYMTRCFGEEISANTKVELEYMAYDKHDGAREIGMRVIVENPHRIKIHTQNGDMANITFKADIDGDYRACFTVPSSAIATRTKLKLDWRLGGMSVDWDVIAKKEHLDEIDSYMERFQRTLKALNDELKDIRLKEKEMRDITEATNSRVTLLSISCVLICLIITGFQVWYLRRFFTKKKII